VAIDPVPAIVPGDRHHLCMKIGGKIHSRIIPERRLRGRVCLERQDGG